MNSYVERINNDSSIIERVGVFAKQVCLLSLQNIWRDRETTMVKFLSILRYKSIKRRDDSLYLHFFANEDVSQSLVNYN